MSDDASDQGPDFTWRVTNTDGNVNLELGTELSDFADKLYNGSTVVTRKVGEALISLGTTLMQSTAAGDEDD